MNIVEKYVKENKILTLTLDDLRSIKYDFGSKTDKIFKAVLELSEKMPVAIKASHKLYDLIRLYDKGKPLGSKLLVKDDSIANEITREILHDDIPFINHTENHAVIVRTANELEHAGFATDGSAFVNISMEAEISRNITIVYDNDELDNLVLAKINTNLVDDSLYNITATAFCEYVLVNQKKYSEAELISLLTKINHLANWLLNVLKLPDLIASGPYCRINNDVFFFDIDNLDTFLETFFPEYESGLVVNAIKEWLVDTVFEMTCWKILSFLVTNPSYTYAVVKINGIYMHFEPDSFICSDLRKKSISEMNEIYNSKKDKKHQYHALQICHPDANTYTAIDQNSMYTPIAVATVSEKAKTVCINFSDYRYVMTKQYNKIVRNCLPLQTEIVVPLSEDFSVDDILKVFLSLYITDKINLEQKFVENPLEETLLKLWNESIAILQDPDEEEL